MMTTQNNSFLLFKDSKDADDYYNLNKHSRNDGQPETESTTNTYEPISPLELREREYQ